jgi:UDPglucose 6-dehydrogenase
LRQAGAYPAAYDPSLPDANRPELDGIEVVDEPHSAAKDVEGLVVLTEWPQFRGLNWGRIAGLMHRPHVVDTRNLLNPAILHRAGLIWNGIGRSAA